MTTVTNPPVTARIGLLVPSSNAVMEVEFYRSLPADITVHTSHIQRADKSVSVDAARHTGRNAVEAASSLVDTELALLVHGHTASSYSDGPAGDEKIARSIAQASGVQALTTAAAVVKCLRSIGARRLWFAAPYPQETTQAGAAFLQAHGFEICSMQWLGVDRGTELKKVEAQTVYDLGIGTAKGVDADAFFMSGTGVRTMAVIGPLERALGKPVITSNLAALFGALDHLGQAARFTFGESRLLDWQRAAIR